MDEGGKNYDKFQEENWIVKVTFRFLCETEEIYSVTCNKNSHF